jgi:hypothetical protein
MCSWRYVMMGPLQAMVVQKTPKHSSRSHIISLIWKTMQRNTWKLTWLTNKIEHSIKKQVGLLRPLPIPEGSWESVSMDFMVSLPPSRGFDAIMVMVDQSSKMTHFIPPRKVPWPKRWECCFLRMCLSIMASPRRLCQIETQSSQPSFGEPCGSAWGRSSRWAPHSDPKWMDKPREWTWLSNNS